MPLIRFRLEDFYNSIFGNTLSNLDFFGKIVDLLKRNRYYDISQTGSGSLAQSVEQRTENPRVPSSILGGATTIKEYLWKYL